MSSPLLGYPQCIGKLAEARAERPDPIARDAAELARLAYGKWAYYRSALEIGATLKDLLAMIRDNPNAEVAVLLLAKAPQLRDRRIRIRIAGVCLFRRTWCNNVFIDFLARHPLDPVKGAGTRLLYYGSPVSSRQTQSGEKPPRIQSAITPRHSESRI